MYRHNKCKLKKLFFTIKYCLSKDYIVVSIWLIIFWDYEEVMQYVLNLYGSDVNAAMLKTQLEVLAATFLRAGISHITFADTLQTAPSVRENLFFRNGSNKCNQRAYIQCFTQGKILHAHSNDPDSFKPLDDITRPQGRNRQSGFDKSCK